MQVLQNPNSFDWVRAEHSKVPELAVVGGHDRLHGEHYITIAVHHR